MDKLNLELRNLKFHENMSEETPCFSADLYQDGKLMAHVKNSGQGGCNDYSPAKGLKYNDIVHFTGLDADCDIMQLAEDLNLVKKNQGSKFVLSKDGKRYFVKAPKSFAQCKKASNYQPWLQKELDKFKTQGFKVLNTNL